MNPKKLEDLILREIEKGNKPFFVNATSGTTVLGSFDDHYAINEVCQKYDLWHHVDACWGGFLALSKKHRHLLQGLELVNSMSFNPHKGLGVPQQCSMLLINGKKGLLRRANTSGASYLFHEADYTKHDIADKTLQCGRNADSLKLWMTLKKHGIKGLAQYADHAMEKTEYFTKLVKSQPEKYELVIEPRGPNICFWYVPPAFRGKQYTFDDRVAVHKIIFERMLQKGSILIQHNPLEEHKLPNFFRMVFKYDAADYEDLKFALDEIDNLGQDLNS